MNDTPCCAHLKIVYRRQETPVMMQGLDGKPRTVNVCADYWECSDCGHPFVPVPEPPTPPISESDPFQNAAPVADL